jgi:hypothetical protein
MERSTYRVAADGTHWRVVGPQVDSEFDSKAQAIDAGRRLSVFNMPSQLVIEKMDGRTEVQHLYGDLPPSKPEPRSSQRQAS